jgi:tRNA pseudouridine32 synthase/23S rRNA pseudouridine746 synthase
MLHSAALIFPHPGGGLKRLEAPTPPDMAALLAELGLD